MPIPSGYFYKDGAYWGPDSTGPFGWNGTSMVLLGGGGYTYSGVFSGKPSSPAVGDRILASDVGPSPGTELRWDGAAWRTPDAAAWRVPIPFIIPSSGTMGNNGALSGIVALPITYPHAYVYLPANAIQAGSAAGWYYTVFSSTTAGTVYQDTYSSGWPSIPASPTAWATTGPGAYTQVITEITALTVTMPANLYQPGFRLMQDFIINSTTAGTKTTRGKFGATSHVVISTTTSAVRSAPIVVGRSPTAQVANSSGSSATGYGSITATNVATDTTASFNLGFTMQIGVAATDYLVVEPHLITVTL